MKNKSHMIISTLFQDENSKQIRYRRSVPQHNKDRIQQTHLQHYTWWKVETFSYKIKNKRRTSQSIIKYFLAKGSTQRTNICHPTQKGWNWIVLLSEDMTLYTKILKDSTIKLLELINKFSKAIWWKSM
jgi:hypothetical protein